MIVLVFFVILIIIIFYIRINEAFLTYTKCDKKSIKPITKDLFKKHGITKFNKHKSSGSGSEAWDIYMPCGYSYIEKELNSIEIKSNNQKIFAIRGCNKITSKNNLWHLLVEKYGREHAEKIMPATYLYNDKDLALFKQKYVKGKMYLLKKNIQRKKGIILSKNYNKILSGNQKKYKLIQEFIPSLLINNRVFNLRLYLLVVCKNKVPIFYLHKNIKCLYASKNKVNKKTDNEDNNSISPFVINLDSNDDEKIDKWTHITNSYEMEGDIYKDNPYTIEELFLFMMEKNNIPEYKIDILRNNIMKNVRLMAEGVKDKLCVSMDSKFNNIYFQLFGLDILIDTGLNPYLLEINKGPDMKPKDKRDYKFKEKIILDMFDKVDVIKSDNNMFINLLD